MFSKWKFMRLRAIERCLADGRIDDAFERLTAHDMRPDRGDARAQKLSDQLTNALCARARIHLQGGRYRDALADLDRVEALGGGGEEVRLLRRRAGGELDQRVRRQGEDREAVERVERDLAAGRLESGRAALEQIEDDGRREQLREQLDVRARRSAELLDEARAALADDDVLAACRLLDSARQRHGLTSETDRLAREVAAALARLAEREFQAGRLERLRAVEPWLSSLAPYTPALAEAEALVRLMARAGRQLAASDFDELMETLHRLRGAQPDAKWLAGAVNCGERLAAARRELLASPLGVLGLSMYSQGAAGDGARSRGGAALETRAAAPAPDAGAPASLPPGGLLLLIDGTGSVLVLGGGIVRIGRAGGDARIQVPLPADVQSHHADIVCDGEAYFLAAHGPTAVNRQRVDRVLLRDGDRIALGEHARLTFAQPSSKSASAALKVSDRCRLPHDVDRVVLLRDTFTIGPTRGDHVPTREGDARFVFYVERGALKAHRMGRNGRPNGAAVTLGLDRTHELGDLRVTVKTYAPAGRPAT